mgnify:FL=1|jgi:hypothetical protein
MTARQPAGQHLAEFNFGTLKHDFDDPRIADFKDNLDLVNGLAQNSRGFVWRMLDDDMQDAQHDAAGVFDGNERTASTLSVWEDFESLSNFVWKTIHRKFFDRRAEWFNAEGNSNFVMWWVDIGHQPTVEEAMDRFNHHKINGDTDFAFGWKHLQAGKK